jgi:cytochrome c553
MSIRTTINGLTVSYTGSTPNFIETTPGADGFYHGLCQVCHTKTTHFNRNSAPDTGHATGGCLACHEHKTGFGKGGSCGTCHGYPPVRLAITRQPGTFGTQGNYSSAKFQDYSGGGGAHTVAGHIPKTAAQSQAWANCNSCHYNTTHATGGTPAKKAFVNVIVNPKYKFNNATSITYNANSCSNVSCHFKPTPNWVTGN